MKKHERAWNRISSAVACVVFAYQQSTDITNDIAEGQRYSYEISL